MEFCQQFVEHHHPGQAQPGRRRARPVADRSDQYAGLCPVEQFCANGFTGQPGFPVGRGGSQWQQQHDNLLNVTGPNFGQVFGTPAASTSAFEYMSNATFATFNSFTGFIPPTDRAGRHPDQLGT